MLERVAGASVLHARADVARWVKQETEKSSALAG